MRIKHMLLIGSLILISCTENKAVRQERSGRIEDKGKDSGPVLYPVAQQMRSVRKFHGKTLYDDYAWMRDDSRKDKAVMDQIRAENEYCSVSMSSLRQIEDNVFNEILPRIDITEMSVPEKIDDYYYYSRNIQEGQYPLHCRKYKSMDAEEEVILDLNVLARGCDYFELGVFSMNPDHRFLAYSVDNSGDENFTLYIKDMRTGEKYPESIENVSEAVWAETGNTLFYSRISDSGRTDAVCSHIIGTETESDRTMYVETDESYFVWIQKTRDRKYILLGTANNNTSEMYFLDSTEPQGFFERISSRENGVEYYVEHHGSEFLIRTNAGGAFNFKIMRASGSSPYRDAWEEYIPHDRETYIEDFETFRDHMVLSVIRDGKKVIRIAEYASQSAREIKFGECCYNVYLGENHQYDTDKLRYTYESPVTPYSVVDYDMNTGSTEVLKKQKVEGYDSSEYGMDMIYALSHDNKKIPVSVVYKTSLLKKDGSNPMLLEGYGAYGSFFDQDFSISLISLLDRGVVYAIAHVRGGIEKGKQWHIDGMLRNKKNTFKDFISCADYLKEQGYTSSDRLVISGASAGGLLVAAVLNKRPDICKAAVLDVPFVDVINTMSDPTLLATVTEYDEWGNPFNKADFEYMLSYDPYQNIKKQPYPEIFVRAGFYDPRVNYWEPLKWVSKIRDNNTADTRTLLNIGMTGHSGYSGKFDLYREIANTYAFTLYHMGIKS